MSRLLNRTTQIFLDVAVLSLALWVACFIRFDGVPPFQMIKRVLFIWPYVVAFEYMTLVAFGVHRFSWRFVGLREVTRIALAIVFSSAAILAVRLTATQFESAVPHLQYAWLPIGVIAINFAVVFLGVVGIRAIRRLVAERAESRNRVTSAEDVRTILIGAGAAGVMVAKELTSRRDLCMTPVAFIDDDLMKVGKVVHGIPVLGSMEQLAAICERTNAGQVLIAIANAPGKAIRRISERCREIGIPAKIIPGIYEIVGGQVNLSRIRELAIEDLLGREPIELEEAALWNELRDRTVLVTGAGGSIGSELCRQVCRFQPRRLALVEQAENALFEIHRELRLKFPDLEIIPLIADICDEPRMRSVFAAHQPEVVFHAAAHKHVPMMEWNPAEAVKNNVFGTRLLADLADDAGVATFVMISTDKAVNPTSVMGASKRVAEIYAQSLSRRSRTRFVTVRFGNVLGSAGSVIPIFKEQIARGGPVTVTHPEMKRYFMTIPEACQLVLQAGTMGAGGEIFVLDMGDPVRIYDLALDLISLSGFTPHEDIDIVFTGTRPGEKLFEELSISEENADKTRHPKIFVGRCRQRSLDDVQQALSELRLAADLGDSDAVRLLLRRIVPEYQGGALIPAPAFQAPPRPSEAETHVVSNG